MNKDDVYEDGIDEPDSVIEAAKKLEMWNGGSMFGLVRTTDESRYTGISFSTQDKINIDFWMSELKKIEEEYNNMLPVAPYSWEYPPAPWESKVANDIVALGAAALTQSIGGLKCMICLVSFRGMKPNRSDGSFVCPACSEEKY